MLVKRPIWSWRGLWRRTGRLQNDDRVPRLNGLDLILIISTWAHLPSSSHWLLVFSSFLDCLPKSKPVKE